MVLRWSCVGFGITYAKIEMTQRILERPPCEENVKFVKYSMYFGTRCLSIGRLSHKDVSSPQINLHIQGKSNKHPSKHFSQT